MSAAKLRLKPCPACEAPAADQSESVGFQSCSRRECALVGPSVDRDGAKWNAIPRRGDAPSGMTDGELIARATRAAVWQAQENWLAQVTGRPAQLVNDELLDAELDRRAAARAAGATP